MKIKRHIVAITALLVFLNCAPVFSASCDSCDPCASSCEFCDMCTDWTFYADWLYWRTRRCDLDYAVDADNNDPYVGKVYGAEPCYESGFRVGVVKGCEELDFGVHYTHFCPDDTSSKTVTGSDLAKTRVGDNIAAVTDPNIRYARGKWELDLDIIDIEAGYNLELTESLIGRLFGGVRIAYIDQNFNVLYAADADDKDGDASAVDRVKQKCDMNAYGFYLGGKGAYAFNKCFDIFFNTSYGFLIAEFERKYFHEGNPGGEGFTTHADLKDECWKLVNNFDFTFGVDYTICESKCGSWHLGFGYEFHQWINVPDFLNFITGDTTGELHIDHNHDNLGFDGLFVRLTARF